MGKLLVNDKEVTTPAAELTVGQIKELAAVPKKDLLYSADRSQVLADDEVVPANGARLGTIPDFARG